MRLLRVGEVLPAAFVVVAAALEVLTEEAMEEAAMAVEVEEATGKLKEKVKAKPLVRGGRGGFFMTKRIELPEVELQIVRPFCLANCS